VLEPAIGYWLNGHPIVERACATIATVADQFRNHWKTSAAVFLPGQGAGAGLALPQCRPGQHLCPHPEGSRGGGGGREAEIERARKAWSQGFVAEAIDKFCRTQEVMDVSGKANKGVLTGQDMAKWQATVEAPLTYDYGRYTVCKAASWTQGPVVLQQLALLKGFDLDGMDPTGPDFIHLQVECLKLAYADREAFYGDPAFVDVPMQTLLSDAYNEDRRKLVDPGRTLRWSNGPARSMASAAS
jgi:gamma-glutamyltranspeptidase/glutathione hydrolase